MRNEQAVVIRKATTAIGVGLLEEALELEGAKGCSTFLCSEPVGLEPPYRAFDSEYVLGASDGCGESVGDDQGSIELVSVDAYPAEEDLLDLDWMESMLRAMSVLDGRFAFELFGSAEGVFVRFVVSRSELAGLRSALLGLFPGLVLRESVVVFPSGLPVVEELVPVGPYHRSLTLLGKGGASPLAIAAGVLSDLSGSDRGVLQVLLRPARPDHDWHYNVENMVEAEERAHRLALLGGLSSQFSYDVDLPPLAEPTVREKVRLDVGFYAVVVRVAVWSSSSERIRSFLQGMRVATGVLRFGNRAFRVLTNDALISALGGSGVRRMVTERLSHRNGLMLTSRELASLVHLPNARVLATQSAIRQRTGLPWRPLEAGAGSVCLGVNEYAGESTSVVIPMDVRLKHTYILGTTGSGKSELIKRMCLDDAVAGLGVCLVDPHGDLCMEVLERLPAERMKDLVIVSFGEEGLVPKWNPFQTEAPPGKLADDMTRAFLAQTTSSGARMEHNFRMLAYIVHELGGTLSDFAELAERTAYGESLRQKALDEIANAQAQRFLRSELPNYRASELNSVKNKLSRLLLDDQLGAMFSQKENTFHPRQWMDNGQIVLVDLSSAHIGIDHARFVGSLLVSLIYRAATSRSDTPKYARRPFMLYIDEFQLLQAATLTEILTEGRKYGLGTILAHQERGQLGKELAQSLGTAPPRSSSDPQKMT